jgi:hypothetical protein
MDRRTNRRPQAGHAGWPAYLPQISGPARDRRPHCQSCWLRIGGGVMAAFRVFRSIELSGGLLPYLASIAATTDTTCRWRFTK